jgi:hypothetical protein
MADPKDIEKTLEASDADVLSLKKDGMVETGGNTHMKAPVADIPGGLNEELLNMLKLGKKSYQFQGLERCIRILEPGTPNQRHCMAMMVNNLSTNTRVCSNCDRIRDPNANPQVINSSMIRLSQKELEQCGLKTDPLAHARTEPIKQPKRLKKAAMATEGPRRTKVKTPNRVTIEMSMEELKNNPDVVTVMLKKTLEAIFELPVSNFREAEAIRVVKDRVEEYLDEQESNDDKGAN